ncbi:hemoglobin [Chitinophaga skermanii]|uniref:Hemoglobin n=2 Tax=Chitinophaga skermanii TaxID=331697 RepID=A0A327QE08_9BACT|nr:hemoglobin [Chitinophaga skermanii]
MVYITPIAELCTMKDIATKEDVVLFVNAFYDKVRQDDLLAPIFDSKIPAERWPAHLERMYLFWGGILFGNSEYVGNPFAHHRPLPVGEAHFERWVILFRGTIDELFRGEKAELAKHRAASIAAIFLNKIMFERGLRQ